MDAYFMVHNVSKGGMPTQRHKTREIARAEAKRLASNSAGDTFTVLQVIEAYAVNQPVPQQIPVEFPSDYPTYVSRGGY